MIEKQADMQCDEVGDRKCLPAPPIFPKLSGVVGLKEKTETEMGGGDGGGGGDEDRCSV